MTLEHVLIGFLALWLTVLLIGCAELVKQHRSQLAALTEEFTQKVNALQSKQSTAARHTIKGQLAEQLAPLLPGFPFVPSDFRFMGAPIDYVAFVGLTDCKDSDGDIEKIVLGDVKQGQARLSKHQLRIKKAVDEGRVEWRTIHISPDFEITRGTK